MVLDLDVIKGEILSKFQVIGFSSLSVRAFNGNTVCKTSLATTGLSNIKKLGIVWAMHYATYHVKAKNTVLIHNAM